MKKIGLLSDTHSHIDDTVLQYLAGCDAIWHAGDIGSLSVTDALAEVAPVTAVYGNIDGTDIRQTFPEHALFECEGMKIWMTHIGGYPPRYQPGIIPKLNQWQPDIFVCGHSHILKVIRDPKRNLLHLNPGAVGKHGFHKVRTLLLFEITAGKPANMKVVEMKR